MVVPLMGGVDAEEGGIEEILSADVGNYCSNSSESPSC